SCEGYSTHDDCENTFRGHVVFSQPCGYAVGDQVFPSMRDTYSWPSNVTVSPVWYASCAPVGCTHSGAPEPSSTTSRHAVGGCHTFAGVNDTQVFPSCVTVQSFGYALVASVGCTHSPPSVMPCAASTERAMSSIARPAFARVSRRDSSPSIIRFSRRSSASVASRISTLAAPSLPLVQYQ